MKLLQSKKVVINIYITNESSPFAGLELGNSKNHSFFEKSYLVQNNLVTVLP